MTPVDYVNAVISYLRANEIAASDILPTEFDVPTFEVLSLPRPFTVGESLALREVCKCVKKYVEGMQEQSVQVCVLPNHDREQAVAVKVGVYCLTETNLRVVGNDGSEVISLPRPEVF